MGLQYPHEIITPKSDGIRLEWKDYSMRASSFYRNRECNRFTLTETLYCNLQAELTIFDMVSGTLKTLTPGSSVSEIELLQCKLITAEQCCVVYRKDEQIYVSMMSLNLGENIYNLTDNAYRIAYDWTSIYGVQSFEIEMSVVLPNIICVKVSRFFTHGRAYLFKIGGFTSILKLEKILDVPKGTCWLGIVDEGYVLANSTFFYQIDFIAICDKNGLFTNLENSEVSSDIVYRAIPGVTYRHAILNGCWFGESFFTSYYLTDFVHKPLTYFFVFQLTQRKWSDIQLNLSWLDQSYFGVSSMNNGILNMFCVGQSSTNEQDSVVKFISYRVPLKNPDTLRNLCWFKFQSTQNVKL